MRNPPQIAVIADDLTGALDAVVAFADVGLRSVVATAPLHLQAALDHNPEVISVSTNSRDLSAAKAAAVVGAVAQAVQGVPVVFKKIDSRLKGNIASEVAALVQVLGFDRALICPAIPQMGRRVVSGLLHGFGVAAALPVRQVLAAVAGLAVAAPDAETDADIDRMLASVSAGTLLIGARGLSAGLARRLERCAATPIDLPLPQPIVFVIGSRDPITLAQVADLRQSQPGARFIAAPNGRADATPARAGVTVLQVTPSADLAAPEAVTQDLAMSYLRSFPVPPQTLVLTGGETAAAILVALGAGVLEVIGEALPGMPLCRALDFETGPLIVTKSGGFGAAEAFSLLTGCNSDLEAPR